MAKKQARAALGRKTASAEGDRIPRKEPYTSERIKLHVERLKEQAQRLGALARAMDDAGVEEIVVDGHAMLLRGLNQIDNFVDNTARAVREAKTAMLDQ